MNIQELNDLLAGKTITRIEAGRTPGWLLIHIDQNIDKTYDMFLTVFCSGHNDGSMDGESGDRHTAMVALHCRYNGSDPELQGSGVDNVRDDRCSKMRMNEDGWEDWCNRVWQEYPMFGSEGHACDQWCTHTKEQQERMEAYLAKRRPEQIENQIMKGEL